MKLFVIFKISFFTLQKVIRHLDPFNFSIVTMFLLDFFYHTLLLSWWSDFKHVAKIGFSKFTVCWAVFNKENSFLSDLSFESNFKIESNLEFPNSVGKKLSEIRLQSKVYFKLPSGLIHPWTTRQSRLARWDTSKTVQNLHSTWNTMQKDTTDRNTFPIHHSRQISSAKIHWKSSMSVLLCQWWLVISVGL